jgi:hypothetical protein
MANCNTLMAVVQNTRFDHLREISPNLTLEEPLVLSPNYCRR